MKQIILLSNNPHDELFVSEVAKASGCELKKCATPAEATVDSLEDAYFFVDASALDEFEKKFAPQIGEGKNHLNPNQVHMIGPDAADDLRILERGDLFAHYLVRRYGDPKETGSHYGKLLMGLEEKRNIGLDGLISRQGRFSVVTLNHSSDKSKALTAIEEFLNAETGFDARMNAVIVNAVDELIMNAIYDAPVDKNGEQALKKLSRNTPVELDGNKSVELQMGFDGVYAAFIVTDHYGSIDKPKLLAHLFSKLLKSDYQIDESQANAGLGLLTTFRTGGSLIFLSEPGVKTEVAVYFRKTRNFREFRSQFKFISVHVSGSSRPGTGEGVHVCE